MKNLLLTALLISFICPSLLGQVSVKDSSISFPAFFISSSVQFPGGDLADRFGVSATIGGGAFYKMQSNWSIDGQYSFMFGNQIEEKDLLANISTSTGAIIGSDGRFADVRLFERGFQVSLTAGKLFPFKKPNPNSGLVLKAGPAFIQHKIKIDPVGNTVPQLSEEYQKGYDRLSNGFGFYEFIGYQYLGNKRRINFVTGIELMQMSTKNQRSYNFDLKAADTEVKNDILIGIKFSWIVPLYKRSPDTFYYN
ncbi:MAG: hypothetical protein HKO56_00940 [Bacteroidia bacterium]|nr:hypothetical protein [Bacteroidia bacterium]NNM15192.1 hypothetical protein [Bacteroidia bacterium]